MQVFRLIFLGVPMAEYLSAGDQVETVKNIINGIDSKDNIWNVNTEKEYHESK